MGSLHRRRAIGPLLDRLERHAPALDRIETRPAPAETHDLVRSRLGTDVERVFVPGGDGVVADVAGALVGSDVPPGVILRYDPPRLQITGTDEGGAQSSLPAPPSTPPARSAMGGGR